MPQEEEGIPKEPAKDLTDTWKSVSHGKQSKEDMEVGLTSPTTGGGDADGTA